MPPINHLAACQVTVEKTPYYIYYAADTCVAL